MKVIRRSVFETNSSSSHSVSIVQGDYIPDKLYVGPGKVCEICPGEFGWEEESYYDAATKASYAFTYAKEMPDYGLGDGEREMDMLKKVIEAVTKAVVQFVGTGDKYHPYGYIDHQSIEDGGPGKEVFASEETLRDFIFNPASELRTDNDNK